MKVKIDGRVCIDRAGFAQLLGIGVHASFDARRRRDLEAGRWFPAPYAWVGRSPFWLLADANTYYREWIDRRTIGGPRPGRFAGRAA